MFLPEYPHHQEIARCRAEENDPVNQPKQATGKERGNDRHRTQQQSRQQSSDKVMPDFQWLAAMAVRRKVLFHETKPDAFKARFGVQPEYKAVNQLVKHDS